MRKNQMNKKLYSFLILMILLFGCLAPKYQRPAAPVPSQFPNSKEGTETKYVSEIKWEDFFKDEKLKKVINLALENNRDLEIASLNADKLKSLYRVQRAQLFPSINGVGTSYKDSIPPAVSGAPKTYIEELYTGGVGTSNWEVDFFGRLRSLKKSALMRYFSSVEGYKSARISIISGAALSYYALAADKENLTLSESTLETRKQSLDLISERYQNGLASEIALNQARYAYELSRTEYLRLRTIVEQDLSALNLIAGTTVSDDLLPKDLSSLQLPDEIPPQLSSTVLLDRPDILSAENNLKAANADIGAARASFFPFIGITSSFGSASSDLSGLFDSKSEQWVFSSQVSIPIFDFGSRWNRLKASKVDKKIAVAQYEKAIQTAFKEVSDGLYQKDQIEEQIDSITKLVSASEETYRLSNIRYESGVDNYLSVLDAEKSLYGAKQQEIAIHLLKIANRITLYKSLGGGKE
jgi:multidrug efflux system outer membrane protein